VSRTEQPVEGVVLWTTERLRHGKQRGSKDGLRRTASRTDTGGDCARVGAEITRLTLSLLGVFAIAALALAAVGSTARCPTRSGSARAIAALVLYRTSAADPLTLAAGALVLVGVAVSRVTSRPAAPPASIRSRRSSRSSYPLFLAGCQSPFVPSNQVSDTFS
jgi:hypothetical protein